MTPGYQDTRIPGYQDTRIPGYQDTGYKAPRFNEREFVSRIMDRKDRGFEACSPGPL